MARPGKMFSNHTVWGGVGRYLFWAMSTLRADLVVVVVVVVVVVLVAVDVTDELAAVVTIPDVAGD